MITILVIDDEQNLVELIQSYLEKENYRVLTANNGAEGLRLANSEQPDLIVLDLMLPVIDGMEVCRRIRQTSPVYIIMLTAKAEEVDRIVGLSVGADDYLTKPFSPRELVARIKALLRRPRNLTQEIDTTPPPRRFGELEVDEVRHEVSYKGAVLGLTTKEFSLMATLSRHPGRVFTRSQLLEQIWGNEYYDDHVVDVHIGNLRKKLEEVDEQTPFIETIRGVGYRFGAKYEIPSGKT